MELLEEVEDDDLNIVESFDREILVPHSETPQSLVYADQKCRKVDEDMVDESGESEPISKDTRLYLLGGVAYRGERSPGKLGLAPSGTRVGDYICDVHGIEKAVVVRKEEGKVRVVGTAATAENQYIAREIRDKGGRRQKVFGTTHLDYSLDYINDESRLDLYVDIATAYQLIG